MRYNGKDVEVFSSYEELSTDFRFSRSFEIIDNGYRYDFYSHTEHVRGKGDVVSYSAVDWGTGGIVKITVGGGSMSFNLATCFPMSKTDFAKTLRYMLQGDNTDAAKTIYEHLKSVANDYDGRKKAQLAANIEALVAAYDLEVVEGVEVVPVKKCKVYALWKRYGCEPNIEVKDGYKFSKGGYDFVAYKYARGVWSILLPSCGLRIVNASTKDRIVNAITDDVIAMLNNNSNRIKECEELFRRAMIACGYDDVLPTLPPIAFNSLDEVIEQYKQTDDVEETAANAVSDTTDAVYDRSSRIRNNVSAVLYERSRAAEKRHETRRKSATMRNTNRRQENALRGKTAVYLGRAPNGLSVTR